MLAELIGANVRKARESKGLTLEALAVRSDIQATAISRLESGKQSPTIRTLHRIATALECAVSDLIP